MKGLLQISTLLMCAILPLSVWAKKNKNVPGAVSEPVVLIIGLQDNVKSNYYYDDLIAKETGLNADSVDHLYNAVIANNIATVSPASLCHFMQASSPGAYAVAGKIQVEGEGDECRTSVTQVSADEWRSLLDEHKADYLLVLNQHYLKRQVQPMRTVFYIISYTLYDKDRQEVYSGNQYFTLMDLVGPEKMKALSRKSSSKIVSGIERSLDL